MCEQEKRLRFDCFHAAEKELEANKEEINYTSSSKVWARGAESCHSRLKFDLDVNLSRHPICRLTFSSFSAGNHLSRWTLEEDDGDNDYEEDDDGEEKNRMLVNFLSRAHKPFISLHKANPRKWKNEKLPPQRREKGEDDDDDGQIIMIMIDNDELRMSKVQCNLTVFILIVKDLDITSNQWVCEEITPFSFDSIARTSIVCLSASLSLSFSLLPSHQHCSEDKKQVQHVVLSTWCIVILVSISF